MSDLSNIDIGVSASSSEATKTVDYAQIEREIDASEGETAIERWKAWYNGRSTIARLLPELLSNIFLLKARAEYEESNSLDWIRVSHVCAQWRRVALECPAFWSYVSCTHPIWALELLRRSKQAPLTVAIPFRRPTCNSTASLTSRAVLGHLWRVRELSISQDTTGGPQELLQDVLDDLKTPALLLEILSVELNTAYRGSKLPDDIFQRAPRLRHLVLKNCGFTGTFPSQCTLTTLKLQYAWRPDNSGNNTSARRTAHLPSLTSLEICSSLNSCIMILDHLEFPLTTKISISIGRVTNVEVPLLSDLGGLLDNKVIQTRCAVIGGDEGLATVLELWSDPGTHLGPPTTPPNVLFTFEADFVFRVFRTIQRGLSMQALQTLHFCEGAVEELDPEAWQVTFGTIASLDTIRVVGHENGVAAALALSQPAEKGPPGPVGFLALRHLVCDDTVCAACDTGSRAYFYEMLTMCEQERRICQTPFQVSFVCRMCEN